MRYVVVGPGAVGGTIGGRLHAAGREVVLVGRGAHAAAIARDGLLLADPDGSQILRVPVVDDPSRVTWRADDLVVLAVKTQDTAGALSAVLAVTPPDVAVLCAQNGVENERLAARRTAHTYGCCVVLPATHLEPGVVHAHAAPVPGLLDVGRYPSGTDARSAAIVDDLTAAGFSAVERPDVLRWKYAKLLANLANAAEAACGPGARDHPLVGTARAEGVACLTAAGVDVASAAEDAERRAALPAPRAVGGQERAGGSSWQSLARGTGTIEADYLNGEVVLLGRLTGTPTPVNALLQRLAGELARTGASPGGHDPDAVLQAAGAGGRR